MGMILEGFEPFEPDYQGWNSDNKIFKKLVEKVNPKTIVEVGSWKGMSAIEMAKYTKAKIYCIDTWLGAIEFYTMPYSKERDLLKKHGYPQVYYQFLSNVFHAGIVDQIEPMPMTSRMGAKLCPIADLIYIDASHEYEDVKEDLKNYWDKLNYGGVMFGDDYGNSTFPGVKVAVDEFGKAEIHDNWFWIFKKNN